MEKLRGFFLMLWYPSLAILLVFAGCAEWEYPALSDITLPATVPSVKSCSECHEKEYSLWKKTRHGNPEKMKKIGIARLAECGACHGNLDGHAGNPDSIQPPSIEKLGKTEQNLVCGKCHYNRKIFGSGAINPHDRHGLFFSVGFEGYDRQISCLDCHEGHGSKADLLKNIRAHTCFRCHKEAIVTMGVFQPVNYLAAGKVCLACHPAHGGPAAAQLGRMAAGALVTCIICHPTGNPGRLGFQPGENNGD